MIHNTCIMSMEYTYIYNIFMAGLGIADKTIGLLCLEHEYSMRYAIYRTKKL